MEMVSFLLLIGPGVLSWKVYSGLACKQSENWLSTLLTVLADSLVILIAAYAVSSFLYGNQPVSFSSEYIPEMEKSIYRLSFVWKYGMLSSAIGVGLAVGKLCLCTLKRRRRKESHDKEG